MSWAAHRKTTRVEDVAYCLLGLFDVHLPPLYGEGENAFRRLQEELLRRSNDQSIFAWFNVDRYLAKFNILKWEILATPILASHPADFSTSGNVGSLHRAPDTPYSLTNNGLELRTRLKQYRATEINAKFCTLELNCAGGQRVHPLHNSIQRTALATQIALLDVGFVVGPRAGVIAEEFMRVHLHPIAKFKLEECPAEGEEVVHVKYVKSEGVPYSFNTTETGLMKRAINYSASARPNSPIVIPAVQPIFLDAGGRNHEEGPISRSIAARYLETRRVNADERLNDSIGLVGTGLHTSANERGAFTRRPEKYTNTK
ncbi:hypothetical protein B0A55_04217 [Friedmanniomyces simplex]|uniref:DUF8212 domain-containing protein n=1 Tax=Friedmanniomyces simplex TaxID=329884 RepID=A0A4U0XVC0_9PEZI|nr:hypothetical protein B0A55_04217 [Friedmanniomyces simplex]